MKEQDWGLLEALMLQMEKIADRIVQLTSGITVGSWVSNPDEGYMGVNSDEWPPVASSTELI